jgi:prophage tail gpP-like protein
VSDIRLVIDDYEWGGWQGYGVQLSMQRLSGSFTLQVTDRWAGQDTIRPVQAGSACELTVDGEVLITGYVDVRAPKYNSQEHRMALSGRDKTADLIDCTAASTQWIGRGLADIARTLARPFGIKVVDLANVNAPFTTLKPDDGETVFEALERAARIRGVLLTTDGTGNLILTRAGSLRAHDPLVLGDNILTGQPEVDLRNVFSHYTLKGQMPGTDEFFGAPTAGVMATAIDTRIGRYRPVTLMAEQSLDSASASDRITWEQNVRWGRAQSVVYEVMGHRQSNGDLWRPNMLVNVTDAYAELAEDERLITDVSYSLDDNGERVELTVMPKEAFAIGPLPEPKAKKSKTDRGDD